MIIIKKKNNLEKKDEEKSSSDIGNIQTNSTSSVSGTNMTPLAPTPGRGRPKGSGGSRLLNTPGSKNISGASGPNKIFKGIKSPKHQSGSSAPGSGSAISGGNPPLATGVRVREWRK